MYTLCIFYELGYSIKELDIRKKMYKLSMAIVLYCCHTIITFGILYTLTILQKLNNKTIRWCRYDLFVFDGEHCLYRDLDDFVVDFVFLLLVVEGLVIGLGVQPASFSLFEFFYCN